MASFDILSHDFLSIFHLQA